MSLATLVTSSEAAAPTTNVGAPYKFLDFFEESDSESFAGRDRDIQECVDRITTQRVFVLYARSGFGKTSLLKAGLFPRLRQQGLRPVYIRTLENPSGDLHAALLAETAAGPSSSFDHDESERIAGEGPTPSGLLEGNGRETSPPSTDSSSDHDLEELVHRLPSTGRIVLVLDQFEEFFILFRNDRKIRADFVETIRKLVMESSLEIHVVFSLREDYLAELDEFQGAIPRLFDRSYRLLPLTPFGAREAIARPLKRNGIAYSPTLVTRMVEELGGHLDPPLIQIFCTEVYHKAQSRGAGHTEVTDEDVDSVGGLDGIFRRYLSEVTGEPALLADPLLARCVLDALLTQENTKRAATLSDLTKARFRASPREIEPFLRVFVRRYIVRRSLRNGVEWFELIHERLVPFVQEWLDQDADFVNFWIARDLITYTSRGEYWRKQSNLLLNAGQIEGVIKPFRGRLELSAMEAEFIFQSALVSGSGDAGYWADRLGHEKSVAMVLAALLGTDPTRRLGAARIAGTMTDPTGVIQEACGRFSNERDQEIRQAAARSYARLRERYGRSRPVKLESRVAAPEPAPPDVPHSGKFEQASQALARQLTHLWPAATPLASGLERQGSRLDRWFASSLPAFFLWLKHFPGGVRRWFLSLARSKSELDFLAIRVQEGDDLSDVAFWPRIRAQNMAADRLRRAEAASISPYARQGAVPGLIAGSVWALTVGYLCLLFYQFLVKASSDDIYFGLSSDLAGLLIIALILGAVVGYATCLADARVAIVVGRNFRPFRLAHSRVFLALLAIPAFFSAFDVGGALFMLFAPRDAVWASQLKNLLIGAYAVLLFLLPITSPHIGRRWRLVLSLAAFACLSVPFGISWLDLQYLTRLLVVIPLCLACLSLCLVLTEGFIYLSMRCFTVRGDLVGNRASRSWIPWVFGTSVSLPLSLLALLCLAARAFGHPVGPTLLSAAAISFVVAVSIPARLFASRLAPLQIKGADHAATSSTLARRFCVTTMVLAPLAFNSIWGLDTFPMMATRYELTSRGHVTVDLHAGPAYPDVSYAKLVSRENLPVVVSSMTGRIENLEIGQYSETSVYMAKNLLKSGQFYMFPKAGRFALKLQFPFDQRSTSIQSVALDLEHRELDSSEHLAQLASQKLPIAIILRPDSHDVWRGKVSIEAPHDPPGSVRPVIRLTYFSSVSAAFEDLHVEGAESFAAHNQVDLEHPTAIVFNAVTVLVPLTPESAQSLPSVWPKLTADGWKLDLVGTPSFSTTDPESKPPESMTIYAVAEMGRNPAVPFNAGQGRPAGSSGYSAPLSPQALLSRAQFQAKQASAASYHKQTWESAAKLYRQALAAGTTGLEVHQGLAVALMELGDLGGAIEEARVARKLASDDARHTNTLAWYLCLAGRGAEALPLARAATAAEPANADYQDTLAHAAFAASKWQEAATAWQRVLAANPKYFQDSRHINCSEDEAHLSRARKLAAKKPDQELPANPFGPP